MELIENIFFWCFLLLASGFCHSTLLVGAIMFFGGIEEAFTKRTLPDPFIFYAVLFAACYGGLLVAYFMFNPMNSWIEYLEEYLVFSIFAIFAGGGVASAISSPFFPYLNIASKFLVFLCSAVFGGVFLVFCMGMIDH